MRKYDYKGNVEQLLTLPEEITVRDFETISKLQQESPGDYTYYLSVFEILGLSEDLIDAMDANTMFSIIRDFQKDFQTPVEYIKEIEFEGYTYSAYDEEFSLGARDFASIEERMAADPFGWITYALAIIFKRTDLSSTEHKANAHRKHKEKLFKDVTMDVALPYIFYVSENYIQNIKLMMSAE